MHVHVSLSYHFRFTVSERPVGRREDREGIYNLSALIVELYVLYDVKYC